MSTTAVDIANKALRYLGSPRITSMTQNIPSAELLQESYVRVRREVLRAFPWNFATRRAELGLDSSTPEFGFDYAYNLPAGCLYVQMADGNPVYRREGGKLLTDEATLKIRYTVDVTNENDFEDMFISAFAARLAAEIAHPLTKSGSKLDAMWTLYRNLLVLASTIDAQENSEAEPKATTWLEARGMGTETQRKSVLQQS